MIDKEIENLIKENFKDTALRIYELDDEDRKSLLAEYREWIINDLDFEEVMMLPYEAYTDKLDSNFLEDSLQSSIVYLLLKSYTSFAINGKREESLEYFSPLQKTTNKVCRD